MTQRNIPKLEGLPFIGHLMAFQRERLGLFQRIEEQCGEIGMFSIGPHDVVMLNNAELIHSFLALHNDATEKVPRIRKTLFPLLGNGTLNALNQLHKPQRARIMPSFQRSTIPILIPTFVKITSNILSRIPGDKAIDILPLMMELALRNIGYKLFSEDISDTVPRFRTLIDSLTEAIVYQSTRLFELPWTFLNKHTRHLNQTINELDKFLFSWIDQRNINPTPDDDVLNHLLTTHTDRQQIRDELATTIFAGHETVGITLTWMWYLVSTHPHVIYKLKEEIDAVLGTNPVSQDSIPKLSYCRAVVHEVLRLYPAAYILNRRVMHDITLPDGWHLPSGSNVGISPYIVHRRSIYWENPTIFDPTRFLNDSTNVPRGAYIPFGDGPHICLGNHLAMVEMIVVLATVIQHGHIYWQGMGEPTIRPLITLTPSNGIFGRITPW
ncbi:cytochrome P450 [Herpetosiphon giganteus]|uniref:cytochrome P450 n=1 Tax=Herpetosiphon giganteus TaxID=2029754 RepID=UPI00195AF934|nr:cytochrome P450 [Herpetosiphon giganteus]MBM7845627.1 cytochrome P450 [Herpetosiphon giganteus]